MVEPITTAPVLVTGASGFIATHIVEQLLDAGYSVRGTVRDPEKASRHGYLSALDRSENLELVAADLTTEGAFEEAAKAVEYVLHTASPYIVSVKDPQRDLVDPAVRGTLSVLQACHASPSVKRVVITSSVAAITDEPDGTVLTEAMWNTKSTLKRNPYSYSKTLAERAAWQFMEDENPGFDLVVVNPFMVIGPEHSNSVNTSNGILVDWTTPRSPLILDLEIGVVDVRDVAAAHLAAMTTPSASGRYLCAADTMTWREMIDVMAKDFPDLRRPRISADGPMGTRIAKMMSVFQPAGVRGYLLTNLGRETTLDNSKIRKELGVEFRPLGETLRDTFNDLIESGKIKTS